MNRVIECSSYVMMLGSLRWFGDIENSDWMNVCQRLNEPVVIVAIQEQ